jgi:hypothetical protein
MSDDLRIAMSKAKTEEGNASQSSSTMAGTYVPTAAS